MSGPNHPKLSARDYERCDGIAAECPVSHWIEIELVGEDGVGIANEEYLIVAPDNVEYRGTTDAAGIARVDGIVKGVCKVNFPKRDGESWHAAV
jgi:hypothetical protein